MSLKEARITAIETRKNIFSVQEEKETNSITFRDIAQEWFDKRMADKKENYIKTVKIRLNKYILPKFGDMQINEITSGMILKLCRKIEEFGFIDTGARVKQLIGQIFRYAIATDRTDYDPTVALAGALQTRKHKHMVAITKPADVAMLMENINNYPRFLVRCALKFSALVFCRPGEVRQAEWSEIDFKAAEWRIPAEKMKMDRVHIVPLARQTIKILKDVHELTGHQKWVFPTVTMNGHPMSDNTICNALHAMGYDIGEMTAHGFRGMASTRLNEMGWPPDVIERQLAHTEQNQVRAAYNHAEYLPERRKMMQAWADYLDELAKS